MNVVNAADDLSIARNQKVMHSSDSNPTPSLEIDDELTDQPERHLKPEDDSVSDSDLGDPGSDIELRLVDDDVDQRLPDDASAASVLQPAASDDQYMGYVTAARAALREVRDTLSQPEPAYSKKLRSYLPILTAALGNLADTPAELTAEVSGKGHRLFVFVHLIYTIVKLLIELIRAEEESDHGPHDAIRSISEPFKRIAKTLGEEICVVEEAFFVAAKGCHLQLVEEERQKICQRLKYFEHELAKWDNYLNRCQCYPENTEKSHTSTTAAVADDESSSSSRRRVRKRWLNFLPSDSSDSSKRFRISDHTYAAF